MNKEQEDTHLYRILFADDNPDNLQVFLGHVNHLPYEVLYATNGQVALDIVNSEHPDLIMLDWDMPIMNGIQTLNELQRRPETKDIPVIIATGVMTNSEDLRHALLTGAVDYLRKPFDAIELQARLQSAIRAASDTQQIKRQKQEIEEQSIKIQELHQKERLLMQDSLQRKERELTTMTMMTHRHQENLREISDMLHRAQYNPTPPREVHNALKIIKSLLEHDNAWELFRKQFESVHPDFFNALRERFPELTQHDSRLCAYIRLGMDNKELAHLTNVAPSTIKKSLNRLKKKLDLGPEASIRDFVLDL